MKRATLALVQLVFVALILFRATLPVLAQESKSQQTQIELNDLERFLDEFFVEQMAELNVPGATITFVQDGEILLSKGYGFANWEEQIPFDPEKTILQIGSISKLFVATAVMQLVEQGKLDLYTDVNQYLGEFQLDDNFPEPVTLDHLLTHTAGFDDFWMSTEDPNKVQPLGDYLADHMPPRVMPVGDVISYSNHGYDLAGYIVERVTGLPFHQYVTENILQPLGMDRSRYLLPPPVLEGLAVGYYFQDGAYTPQPITYDNGYPSGSLLSTSADMARFMIAHLQDGCYQDTCILGTDTVAEMHQQQFTHHPQLSGWTYGFQEGFPNGQRAIGHSGAARGFTNNLILVPEYGLGYFVSFNHESLGLPAKLLPALQEQFWERYFPAAPVVPSDTSAGELARLTGSYRPSRHIRSTVDKISVLERDLLVTASESGLLVRDSEYVKIGPLLFQEVGGDRRIAFRQDDKDRITHTFWGPYAYERLAWYETGVFQRTLFDGFGWFWGAVILIGPLALLIRRWRKQPSVTPFVRRAYWLAVLPGFLNVIFLLSLIKVFWTSRTAMTILLILPLMGAILTLGVLIVAAFMWWRKLASFVEYVYYSLIALVTFLFVWFLHSWNFLGFRFG